MKGRVLAALATGVLFAGGVLLVAARPGTFLPALANWLDVGQPPRPVDYAIELPGDADRRPFVVAALLKTGFARAALIPETADSPEEALGILPRNSEVSRRVLRYRGVREDQIIILPGASEHTAGDLEIVVDFFHRHPQSTFAVVTSAFHTRRARWMFHRLIDATQMERVVFLSAPNPEFQASNWWRNPQGVEWILSEYLKLLAYWFVYGSGLYWGAGSVCLVAGLLVYRRVRRRADGVQVAQ